MKCHFFLLAGLLLLNACQSSSDTNYQLIELPLLTQNSGMPNFFVDAEGQATLTWVERPSDTLAQLKMAQLDGGSWSEAKVISQGSNWFVNWADFPAFASFPGADSHMTAHWLQKRAAGTYDYDIRVATSLDGGQQWSDSFVLHRDSIAAEHGFVTLLPIGKDRVFATWLDGRNTKTEHTASNIDHGHGGGAAMTLRTAEFDAKGNLYEEEELDTRICDCCQTDAVITDQGPIVVYRDRSEQEIRDISVVRKVRGIWSDPQTIGNDHWQINGCPVNGPAIAAQGNQVAIAWFTMAADTPKVQVVFSQDNGASFGMPIQVDAGRPLGRVDIVFDKNDQVLVSYIEDHEANAEVRVIPVGSDGVLGSAVVEIPIDAARRSGFPILEKLKKGYLIAMTEVLGEQTQVKTYLLQ